MTTAQPPAFAEDDRCKACNTVFTFTNRRHHCRNCGESFCTTCCNNRDILHHFGMKTQERTCDACHRYLRNISPAATYCTYLIPQQLSAIGGSQAAATLTPVVGEDGLTRLPVITCSPFPPAGSIYPGDAEEQCREAIKCNDLEKAKELIEKGLKSEYHDKTGNTLLHLACIMDRVAIVQVLCEHGANPYQNNRLPKPESAYEVSSLALKHKFAKLFPPHKYGLNDDIIKRSRKKKTSTKRTSLEQDDENPE